MSMSLALFVIFFALALLGVPLAISLGVAGTVAVCLIADMPFSLVAQSMFSSMNSFIMAAVPLFVLVGRRDDGVLHMMRALFGAVGLFVAFSILDEALCRVNWLQLVEMLEQGRRGPAIEMFMDVVDHALFWIAVIVSIVAFVLFAWPARKYPDITLSAPSQEVSS